MGHANTLSRTILLILVCACAACNGSPSRTAAPGALLLRDNFDGSGRWDQADVAAASVLIRDGVFHFEADAGQYIFSVDYQTQTNVIVEVDAFHLSDDDSSGFGIICRANTNGEGYYFLIGADGSGTIRRSRGRDVTPLVAWTKTGGIVTGASNRIRAVCDGDYLALYVNGIFVGEARDSLYSSGYTGLTVVTTRPGQRISVDFDVLRIYSVP